jgi:hypothetical protein
VVASTGQIPWPPPGRTRDRHRAGFTTAPGQKPMALDTWVGEAQDRFARLLKEFWGPSLREAGFSGSGKLWTLPDDRDWIMLGFQTSTSSTGDRAKFTMNLLVVGRASGSWPGPARAPSAASRAQMQSVRTGTAKGLACC